MPALTPWAIPIAGRLGDGSPEHDAEASGKRVVQANGMRSREKACSDSIATSKQFRTFHRWIAKMSQKYCKIAKHRGIGTALALTGVSSAQLGADNTSSLTRMKQLNQVEVGS